jgi:hypothetical protein
LNCLIAGLSVASPLTTLGSTRKIACPDAPSDQFDGDWYCSQQPHSAEKKNPAVFGTIQRCGMVVIEMLPNVRQTTIELLIKTTLMSAS